MGLRELLFGKRRNAEKPDTVAAQETLPKEEKPEPSGGSSLLWRTPGDADPSGRAKVFYCAHPIDHDRYLDALCEDVFAHERNRAAVFYLSPPRERLTGEDRELLEEVLPEMKLLLLPVTSNFLYLPNDARERILPEATALHIPVLPVLMEKGLEQDFNDLCGALHCLDRIRTDDTQVPYAEKVKKFLSEAIENDEVAERIRSAFDAYIFLSYRKKDRKYAREIMRLIHKNDFCRDIAIWYDEYLVPGEDFNASIEKAMEKSSLFAMAITPSLLEIPNYVWSEEYKRAKNSGKAILGIQAKHTDPEKLSELYEGLTDYADTSDEADLRERLSGVLKGIALSGKDSSPEHLFFIGLAYLGGIDVEKDPQRALEMITMAADRKLPEALKKLVFMYRHGEGTGRDPEKALSLQEELFDLTWERYCEQEYEFPDAFGIAMDLIDAYFDSYDFDSAAAVWDTVISSVHDYGDTDLMMRAYDKGGDILTARGEFDKAVRVYLTALSRLKELPATSGNVRFSALFHKKIGNLLFSGRAYGDAAECYQNGLEAIGVCAGSERENPVRQMKADLLQLKAQAVARAFGDYAQAGRCADEGVGILEKIAAETDLIEDRRFAAAAHQSAEDLYRKKMDMQKAEYYGRKACGEYRKIAEECGTPDALDDLALSLKRLSWYHDDEALLREASGIWKDLADRYPGVARFRRMSGSKDAWDEHQKLVNGLRSNPPFR